MSDSLLKQVAQQFLLLTASGAVDEAYERFVAHDFIHHNQYFKGDRESLRLAMRESAASMPDKQLTVHSMVQEQDRVTTYSHVQISASAMDIAVFHMFRFENGKIAELWDVGQQIANESPNQNGLF